MGKPKRKSGGAGVRGFAVSSRHKAVSSSSSYFSSGPQLNKTWIALPAIVMTAVALTVVLVERWYAGPLVSQPLDAPLAVSDDWRNHSIYDKRLWGSYRSNVYFGMRPRIPESVVAGVMWFSYDGKFGVRHACEHGDRLQRYGWTHHDGRGFGQQEILDNMFSLNTDFLTLSEPDLGDTWTARFSLSSRVSQPQLVSLIMYVYNEGAGEIAFAKSSKNSIEEIYGHTPEFNQFRVHFPNKVLPQDAVHSFMSARLPSAANLANQVRSRFVTATPRKKWPTLALLPGEVRNPSETKHQPNFVAYQVTGYLPYVVDMVMETGMFSAAFSISGDKFKSELETRRQQFDAQFEETFELAAKGFGDAEISFAKAVFSNLVGGISYFYGKSKVISRDIAKPVDYWEASLYTAVPSRSFFPRGFLWDEGFHQLLVAHWDTTITKDVIAHWLDLMNVEGWIPREQILGEEARSKVPSEFVVQHNENANPPTFFLTLDTLLQLMTRDNNVDLVYLRKLYPRLQTWFDWFNSTQTGPKPLTYRWRGRNSTTDVELNPKTLTSGLDDFPRASHPTDEEYHVDLRCWMTLASGVMAKIAGLLGEDGVGYRVTHQMLSDPRSLDQTHWDNKRKTYSDYGLHTSAVKLVTIRSEHPNIPSVKRRRVKKEPTLRFVNSFGYVNLFPFLLKLVPPNSDKLGYILERLRNETVLWTDFGLRSLSRSDSIYSKHNTEHDPPYWRGAIWINMNYLAVRALHHYSSEEGPHRTRAKRIYQELRSNLIRNIFEQYQRTGYIWEQYDDITGAGKGTHPFTGWSSLVVLMMAEKY